MEKLLLQRMEEAFGHAMYLDCVNWNLKIYRPKSLSSNPKRLSVGEENQVEALRIVVLLVRTQPVVPSFGMLCQPRQNAFRCALKTSKGKWFVSLEVKPRLGFIDSIGILGSRLQPLHVAAHQELAVRALAVLELAVRAEDLQAEVVLRVDPAVAQVAGGALQGRMRCQPPKVLRRQQQRLHHQIQLSHRS
jgi:hypothetical protein